MKTTINRLSAVLIASALSLAATQAMAQTPPAKAPAKPAAKAKPTGKDKLQTKEELRACMMLKESNNARTTELDAKAEQMRKEKQELLKAPPPQDLTAEKAAVEAKLNEFKAADAAVGENTKVINAWNDRLADFEQRSKIMANAERERKKLMSEREGLKVKEEKLVAERAVKHAAYEEAVTAINAKITSGATSNANADWNKRNNALADEQERLSADRDRWLADCGNRRFIDDDEREIRKEMKAGK